MAKAKEWRGDFWLDSDPSKRVPGQLTFHDKHGGRLTLNGVLNDGSRHGEYDVIRGRLLGCSCVLLNCFDLSGSSAESSPGEWEENQTVFVNAVLIVPRAHEEAPAETFVSVTTRLEGLPEFDARNPFDHDHSWDEGIQTLTVKSLERRVVETRRSRIVFTQGGGWASNELRKQALTSTHSVHVIPHSHASLDEMIELLARVKDLIALSMHQDCRPMGPLRLDPTPREEENPSRRWEAEYTLHAVWPRGRQLSHPFVGRILTFDALTPEAIARWLELDADCGHVISRLVSMRYTRKIAYEDAMLRVVAAADSLHRVVTGKEREVLTVMLKDLADYAGETITDFIPDVDAWATAVIDERNNAAHNKGQLLARPTLTDELVSSVYFLVFIGLLRRADAPASAFEALRKSSSFADGMKRVWREFGGRSEAELLLDSLE